MADVHLRPGGLDRINVLNDPVNWIDPTGESAMEFAMPLALVVSQLDTVAPGPMDVVAAGILGIAWLMDNEPDDISFPDGDPGGACPNGDDDRDPAKDRRLSKGEIKKLKEAGYDIHDLKPDSRFDLFKDRQGNIFVKPKSGVGPGDPTGLNITNF